MPRTEYNMEVYPRTVKLYKGTTVAIARIAEERWMENGKKYLIRFSHDQKIESALLLVARHTPVSYTHLTLPTRTGV